MPNANGRLALWLCLFEVLQVTLALGPAQAQPSERVLPLGTGEILELHGAAWAVKGKEPRRPLRQGEHLWGSQRIETSPDENSRIEVRFPDGSLLRIGPSAAVTVLCETRQVALHRGRILVAADRMLGSLAVMTRWLMLRPEGTTYVVELDDRDRTQEPRLELTVLEGAVCACPVMPPDGTEKPAPPRELPKREMIILPGERLEVKAGLPPLRPQPESLTARLADEPLIAGFARRLPTWLRIDDLADQQRRRFLAGRNERLRREIFWKRPPRPPVKLPPLFTEPDSVIVRYEYPP